MAINQLVLQFMQDGNRPYVLNDVYDKLGKDYGKTALQKALDSLVSQGKLLEKVYPKQRIYVAVQRAETQDSEKAHHQLREMNARYLNLDRSVKERSAELARLEQELKKEGLTKSASQLKEENAALKVELKIIEEQLTQQERRDREAQKAPKIDPKEQKEIEKNYDRMLAAYKKRKALCRDMIDAIMESYPGSKKKLMQDTEVETDEDAGFFFDPPDSLV